jgi:hypothetical protein
MILTFSLIMKENYEEITLPLFYALIKLSTLERM